MNFEDLQKNWQSQPVNALPDTLLLKSELQSKWQKHQRKVLLRNIFLSISFIAVLIVVGSVYIAFHNKYSWPFAVSIGAMYLLLIVYIIVSWRGYAFKKEQLDVSSIDNIAYQLKKLNWQKKIITTYSLVYSVLLWLILIMYEIEITRGGTFLFKFTALAITTAYVLGVALWTRFTKQKKQLAKLDEMIDNLKGVQSALL